MFLNTKYLFPDRESNFILEIKNSCVLKSEIKAVPNGIVLPLLYGNSNSGGVCDSEGRFLDESLLRGEWIKRGRWEGI